MGGLPQAQLVVGAGRVVTGIMRGHRKAGIRSRPDIDQHKEKTMGQSVVRVTLWAVLMTAAGNVMAVDSVLSGIFDGSEDRLTPLPGTCGVQEPLAYRESAFQVSATGSYAVVDVFNWNGVDVSALIYEGGFDPDSPQDNLLTQDGVDISGEVELAAGTDYVLVVQHWCENMEGAWSVALWGPGSVNSATVVQVPDFTAGELSSSDPVADTECGSSEYQVVGPIQVATGGTYYYTDISVASFERMDACVQVYTAPFDPNNPNANRVGGYLDDFGTVELQAGRDYYFAVQPWGVGLTGDFFYVLAPPASFRINKALAGAWFDPPTAGQGFFIDVYDNSNQMFLSWFTYDVERPPEDSPAIIGEPGHRWFTALGPFDGDTAELPIYLARGMVFDSADPPVESPQPVVGSMTVQFNDCTSGVVNYTIDSPPLSGQINIQPIAEDYVPLCESQIDGPGMPGPL
jgi:hypothetical protein